MEFIFLLPSLRRRGAGGEVKKRNNMKKLKIILLIFLTATALYADGSDFASSGYSYGAAEYLKLARHAQSAGLANAVVAWQEEFAGLQYNPAILDAVVDIVPVAATYSFMTWDRKHVGMDAAMPLGEFIISGLSLMKYGVGNIEGRDSLGNKTNDFDYSANAVALSVAGKLLLPVSVGITARYIHEQMSGEEAHGMGFDAGMIFYPFTQLCIGLSGRNMGSYLWWTTGHRDIVLPTAQLGIAGRFLDTTLITELDVAKTLRQPIDVSLGLQYKLLGMILIRGGMATSLDLRGRDYRKFDFSVGLGLRYSWFGVDYAMPINSARLGLTHKISVIGKFPSPF